MYRCTGISYIIYRKPYVIHHVSYRINHTSYINTIRHKPYIINHTSFIIYYVLYIKAAALCQDGSVTYADWPKTRPRKLSFLCEEPKKKWERMEKKEYNTIKDSNYRDKFEGDIRDPDICVGNDNDISSTRSSTKNDRNMNNSDSDSDSRMSININNDDSDNRMNMNVSNSDSNITNDTIDIIAKIKNDKLQSNIGKQYLLSSSCLFSLLLLIRGMEIICL
jgi:hypothetical protein